MIGTDVQNTTRPDLKGGAKNPLKGNESLQINYSVN